MNESGRRLSNSDRLEMIGSIIDVFEDFLDDHGIVINNHEKDGDDCGSNIYGTDYGNLENEIEAILISYNLIKRSNKDG